MGNKIVMKTTIDYLATTKQFDNIDNLMGSGGEWETVNLEDGTTYYKKEFI
jgi:hypothetical protein